MVSVEHCPANVHQGNRRPMPECTWVSVWGVLLVAGGLSVRALTAVSVQPRAEREICDQLPNHSNCSNRAQDLNSIRARTFQSSAHPSYLSA
jgi:hypothetical protein